MRTYAHSRLGARSVDTSTFVSKTTLITKVTLPSLMDLILTERELLKRVFHSLL